MELSQLKHFVETARQLNFTRAAESLGIGQPALSRSIGNLESSVGVRLLDRTKRSVKLTEAGKAFLDEIQAALARIENARSIAQRVNQGEIGTIRIGWIATAHHYGLQHFIRKFRAARPNIELIVEEIPNSQQPDALRQGVIDLGFCSTSGANLDDLAVHVIDRCSYLAAVPSAWPEAKQKRLRLKDLANRPFVCKALDAPGPRYYNEMMAACLADGFTPRIAQFTRDSASIRSLVACEIGIAFMPQMKTLPRIDGVTYVPLAGLPSYFRLELAMLWVPRGVPPALAGLIQLIRQGR